MKRIGLFVLISLLALFVVACQPQVVEVEVTREVEVEVEKEVVVVEEVEVVKEVEVEKEVEKIVEVEVEKELTNRGIFRISHGLAWGGTENMDPVDTGRLFPAVTMVYDGLSTTGPDGSPKPTLAQSLCPFLQPTR